MANAKAPSTPTQPDAEPEESPQAPTPTGNTILDMARLLVSTLGKHAVPIILAGGVVYAGIEFYRAVSDRKAAIEKARKEVQDAADEEAQKTREKTEVKTRELREQSDSLMKDMLRIYQGQSERALAFLKQAEELSDLMQTNQARAQILTQHVASLTEQIQSLEAHQQSMSTNVEKMKIQLELSKSELTSFAAGREDYLEQIRRLHERIVRLDDEPSKVEITQVKEAAAQAFARLIIDKPDKLLANYALAPNASTNVQRLAGLFGVKRADFEAALAASPDFTFAVLLTDEETTNCVAVRTAAGNVYSNVVEVLYGDDRVVRVKSYEVVAAVAGRSPTAFYETNVWRVLVESGGTNVLSDSVADVENLQAVGPDSAFYDGAEARPIRGTPTRLTILPLEEFVARFNAQFNSASNDLLDLHASLELTRRAAKFNAQDVVKDRLSELPTNLVSYLVNVLNLAVKSDSNELSHRPEAEHLNLRDWSLLAVMVLRPDFEIVSALELPDKGGAYFNPTDFRQQRLRSRPPFPPNSGGYEITFRSLKSKRSPRELHLLVFRTPGGSSWMLGAVNTQPLVTRSTRLMAQ